MSFSFTWPRKRMALLATVPVSAALMSLAGPAGPASAATNQCNHFSAGGVNFAVCIEKLGTGKVQAQIGQISGTFVSGSLALFHLGNVVKTSCKGQWHPGQSCSFTFTGSTGTYHSQWQSAGDGFFSSPTISA